MNCRTLDSIAELQSFMDCLIARGYVWIDVDLEYLIVFWQ